MTLARAPQSQLTLLDTPPCGPITSIALARNIYGTIAQELAAAALALRIIPIDSRCAICFDAERDGHFYEIKSVHRSGKLVIYDWRMTKEITHPTLIYILVVHRARRARTITALLDSLHGFLEFWLVPATCIHQAAYSCPKRFLSKPSTDPRNGYSRKGYVDGYRNVSLAPLRPATARSIYFSLYNQSWQATIRE